MCVVYTHRTHTYIQTCVFFVYPVPHTQVQVQDKGMRTVRITPRSSLSQLVAGGGGAAEVYNHVHRLGHIAELCNSVKVADIVMQCRGRPAIRLILDAIKYAVCTGLCLPDESCRLNQLITLVSRALYMMSDKDTCLNFDALTGSDDRDIRAIVSRAARRRGGIGSACVDGDSFFTTVVATKRKETDTNAATSRHKKQKMARDCLMTSSRPSLASMTSSEQMGLSRMVEGVGIQITSANVRRGECGKSKSEKDEYRFKMSMTETWTALALADVRSHDREDVVATGGGGGGFGVISSSEVVLDDDPDQDPFRVCAEWVRQQKGSFFVGNVDLADAVQSVSPLWLEDILLGEPGVVVLPGGVRVTLDPCCNAECRGEVDAFSVKMVEGFRPCGWVSEQEFLSLASGDNHDTRPPPRPCILCTRYRFSMIQILQMFPRMGTHSHVGTFEYHNISVEDEIAWRDEQGSTGLQSHPPSPPVCSLPSCRRDLLSDCTHRRRGYHKSSLMWLSGVDTLCHGMTAYSPLSLVIRTTVTDGGGKRRMYDQQQLKSHQSATPIDAEKSAFAVEAPVQVHTRCSDICVGFTCVYGGVQCIAREFVSSMLVAGGKGLTSTPLRIIAKCIPQKMRERKLIALCSRVKPGDPAWFMIQRIGRRVFSIAGDDEDGGEEERKMHGERWIGITDTILAKPVIVIFLVRTWLLHMFTVHPAIGDLARTYIDIPAITSEVERCVELIRNISPASPERCVQAIADAYDTSYGVVGAPRAPVTALASMFRKTTLTSDQERVVEIYLQECDTYQDVVRLLLDSEFMRIMGIGAKGSDAMLLLVGKYTHPSLKCSVSHARVLLSHIRRTWPHTAAVFEAVCVQWRTPAKIHVVALSDGAKELLDPLRRCRGSMYSCDLLVCPRCARVYTCVNHLVGSDFKPAPACIVDTTRHPAVMMCRSCDYTELSRFDLTVCTMMAAGWSYQLCTCCHVRFVSRPIDRATCYTCGATGIQ